ncbi:metalloregulator ArsR/SmtB family transcription factor [Ramlibacter sp.]|uniref:ArsR/SmtB family transcription factor n=1 Tax=Ramlibacter sp. TaxID=1917967 RepID=UPI002C28B831|nr:metalloregulator ArsR/SmtB family transcription factor [Ramlibacter sp.]HWI80557.1 metalloregulator ArsR/SmtB family transcription factor [Ramlibacter sp.]
METALLDDRTEEATLRALAALGQVQRLRAFRALVVAGRDGLSAGALAEELGLSPSGLSFHLKELAGAGLVASEPRGRYLIYRADYARMDQLLAYLTRHCCQGPMCETAPSAACSC